MDYLELRKNLNLTLKQFKTKITILNIDFKDDYSDEEVEKIISFVSSKVSKADLRDLPYINQGWIPLRKIKDEINVSSGTINSYVKLLNINVYKPIHQLSFISKEDREKILNFINEHKDSKERKIHLSEQTCLKKFGVENGAKSEEIRNKISENIKKVCTKERTEKIHKTKLEKYGKKSITNSEKSMKSRFERYGSYFVSHKYEYDNLYFDSSWELYYYIYQKEILNNNINRGKIFEYEFEGKIHHYECDFLVNDKNIEIKGSQYLNENGDLIFPYVNCEKVDSDKMQKLWSAKSQCMKDNNINIVSEKEMNDIIRIVDEKYTSDYVSLFEISLEFPYPILRNNSDYDVIRYFHKSIYHAHRYNELSPFEAWQDKNLIKKCALNRLKYIGSCKPSDILQGFNVSKIAPKVSVFNPKLAEELLNKYCTQPNIFDPFSGFSGRMIASCNLGKSYRGQDINEEHVKESNEIIKYKNYSNVCVKVQDILTDNNKELQFTTLFTCSPYSLKEIWNENETDISCDEWIDICINKYKCDEYIFIVDDTEKYKNCIVETIKNKSHFGTNHEKVIYIRK